MPRMDCEAVPEGNCPILQQEEFGSGKPTLADTYRLCVERFDRMDDRWNKKLDEIFDEMREMDQHVTRLEHGARQPRLAMEADGYTDTKTRERTEGAATAVQAMRGDYFSARLVEPGPNTNSTSFGVKAEPPALPCRIRSSVVSPILEDTLISSRWWLSSHRRSLHCPGDHLQRATSSVIRDRGDESRR